MFRALHRGKDAFAPAWKQVRKVVGLSYALGAGHVVVIPELWQPNSTGTVIGRDQFSAEEWRTS